MIRFNGFMIAVGGVVAAMLLTMSGCHMPSPGEAEMFPVNPIDQDGSANVEMSSSGSKQKIKPSTSSLSPQSSSSSYGTPDYSTAPADLPSGPVEHAGY